jgi:hypothetical protein
MVLIKAKRLPLRLPRPQGSLNNAEGSPPSSPASAGLFAFRASEASVSGLLLLLGRNWRLDSVLGLRLGLVP